MSKICVSGRRCRDIFVCKYCAEQHRRKYFKSFCEAYDKYFKDLDFYYYVIKPIVFDSLKNNFELIFGYFEQLREIKKRKKAKFFAVLEVSFSSSYGFLPHINIITFNELYLKKHKNVSIWKRKITKEQEKQAKKIAWYILKRANLDEEKAIIVKKTFNRRRKVLHTNEFKTIDWIDEILQCELDFRFLGTYPIRSKEEVELRKKVKKMRQEINKYFKKELNKIRGKNDLQIKNQS